MRTPFASVSTTDQILPTDSSGQPPKMQKPIQHPNAVPGPHQRYSSTVGIDGHPQQNNHHDTDNHCERSRAEERAEGKRSRRASVDVQQVVKKQRFEILRRLGSGTYGKVSLALDHRTGEEVRIHTLHSCLFKNYLTLHTLANPRSTSLYTRTLMHYQLTDSCLKIDAFNEKSKKNISPTSLETFSHLSPINHLCV